jgi:hypothetical protein
MMVEARGNNLCGEVWANRGMHADDTSESNRARFEHSQLYAYAGSAPPSCVNSPEKIVCLFVWKQVE